MTDQHSDSADWAAIETALDAALDLDDEAREAWLQQLAADHGDLATKVRALLAKATVNTKLDAGPDLLADDLARNPPGLANDERLGPWQISEVLGEGGMGRVYLAERADGAFEKRVAIKVLRRERRLPEAVLRHERALLARLEHPAITRLLDGGVSTEGDAYLVMEYVQGESLAEWCAQHRPDLKRRIALFQDIAAAVAYAHRELVVHGDIKPDNVLVDDSGRVRLLDFGIARLVAETGTAIPADAQPRALTLAYAAPECRRGAPPDVRSDVFALGALLHFLLSGRAPTDEPTATAPIDPRKLRGDLDAILSKALAEEPTRRYADVPALREDIERYRHHGAVCARDAGAMYRSGRFVRRHWLATAASAILAGVLIGASTVVALQNRTVRAERDRAELEVARSQTVLDYLMGILGSTSTTSTQGPTTVSALLAEALTRIDRDFRGDASARQLLLARLADLNVRLGNFSAAETLLQEFRKHEHGDSAVPVQARVLDNLALVKLHKGKLEPATQLSSRALALLEPLASDTRGVRSQVLVTRAQIQRRSGHTAQAIDTLRQALALRLLVSPADAAQSVVVRNSLAVALMRQADYRQALDEFELLAVALASSQREHSMDAANIYNNYASTAFAWGQYARADTLFAKAMRLQQEVFGPSAPLAALLNNYGKLKIARGDIDAGADLIEHANKMMVRFAGAGSIDAQLIRIGSGDVARARGDFATAENTYASIRAALAAKLGKQHPLLTRVRALELIARARRTDLPVSDSAFATLLDAFGTSRSTQRPRADLLCLRAELALAQNAIDQALQSATTCAELRAQSQAPASPTLALAEYLKAAAMWRQQAGPSTSRPRATRWQQLTAALGKDHPQIQRLADLRRN